MQLAYGGTSLLLSAGSTNLLPVETPEDPRRGVVASWRASARQIEHVLRRGFYHGWDLHPGQIPVRYAACYRFFRAGAGAAMARLRTVLDASAAASVAGRPRAGDDAAVLDDAATGQALVGYLARARGCGAIDDVELAAAGLRPDAVGSGRFLELLNAHRTGP